MDDEEPMPTELSEDPLTGIPGQWTGIDRSHVRSGGDLGLIVTSRGAPTQCERAPENEELTPCDLHRIRSSHGSELEHQAGDDTPVHLISSALINRNNVADANSRLRRPH